MSLLIAELGQAHDGSLGIAHSYIDALASTGVDVVKFQTHIAEAESSAQEPFRVNFSYEDKTRYDYWDRMSFTPEQWAGLKQHCEDAGVEFMSSPFSLAAVELLEKLGVKRYKIGSGEVNNGLILERIRQTGKPVILSSGMSNFTELDDAVSFFRESSQDLSVLQCTTSYPTAPEDLGLNVISDLQARYPDCKIGFSDHSGDIYACLAACALGAEIFEFHCVFDKTMFGPDATSSLTLEQIKSLVKGVKAIELSLKHPVDKHDNSRFKDLKNMFEKSLAINKNLPEGSVIGLADLESKKPAGMGIPASRFKELIGAETTRDLNKWDFLKWEDFKHDA